MATIIVAARDIEGAGVLVCCTPQSDMSDGDGPLLQIAPRISSRVFKNMRF